MSESERMHQQQERVTSAVGARVTYGQAPPPGRPHERTRTVRAARRPGPGAVAALLLAPLLLGYGVDALTGGGPGWGVVAGATAGALLASLAAVRRRALGWVAPLPALAVAAVTAGAVLTSDDPLPTRLVRWAVAVFPAMASAECAVLAVALTAAVLRARMNGRGRV